MAARTLPPVLALSLGSQFLVTDPGTGMTADAAILAAVRQTLAIPAGVFPSAADWARLTSLSVDSNQVLSLQGIGYAINLQSLTLVPSNFSGTPDTL